MLRLFRQRCSISLAARQMSLLQSIAHFDSFAPTQVNNSNNQDNNGELFGHCTFKPSSNGSVSTTAAPLTGLSLEEMLEQADCEHAAGDESDHSCGICAEDIDFFRSNKHRVQQHRQELRCKLKSQFLDMQRRLGCASPSCVSCVDGTGDKCVGRSGNVVGGGDLAGSHADGTAKNHDPTKFSDADKKKIHGMRA